MKNIDCPLCNTGKLDSFSEIEDVQYKDQSISVQVEYSCCDQCHQGIILPDQIKSNDRLLREAWRKADGFLTGDEIVALRQHLKLTQQQAAQMFGGGANAFSKYERGEVIQSEAMDKLMRLALENKPVNVSNWLKNRAGLMAENKFSTQNYNTKIFSKYLSNRRTKRNSKTTQPDITKPISAAKNICTD